MVSTMKAKALVLLTVSFLLAMQGFSQSRPPWPTFKQLEGESEDLVDLRSADLPDVTLNQVQEMAAPAIDSNCRKALDDLGANSLLRKLGLKQVKLTDAFGQTYAIQGGMDVEDSSDHCFADSRLNFETWIISVTDKKPVVLLRTLAMSFAVMSSGNAGFHDVVTLKHRNSKYDFDLFWWKFDGTQYRRERCATVRVSKSGNQGAIHGRPCGRMN
jgi:hypothetical protein